MEAFVKALELGAKYACAVFLVSGFVLMAPGKLANRLHLQTLRKENSGYFRLMLILFPTKFVFSENLTLAQLACRLPLALL